MVLGPENYNYQSVIILPYVVMNITHHLFVGFRILYWVGPGIGTWDFGPGPGPNPRSKSVKTWDLGPAVGFLRVTAGSQRFKHGNAWNPR